MGTATGELDGSGAQVFSVHPTGSGNPNSNGKVYEYSRRLYGLVTGPRNSVYDLHMKRSIHNNGCAVFGQYNQAYRCIFEDGVKHNAYFSGNSRAEDCIVWKADWGERSNWTGIVNFELVGTNLSNINVGCVARVDKEYMDSAIAAGNGLTAFYSHTAGGVGDNWHTITYENCSSINCDTGFSVADTDTLVINSSYVEDGVVPFVVGGLQSTLTDVAAKSPGSTHNLQRFINAANGANTTIDGARVYATTTNDGLYYDTASTGTVSIGNSVFFLNDPASYANIIKSTGTKIVNMSGCVLNGDQSIADNSVLFTEAPGNISNNAYVGSVNFDFHISSVDYTTYADFETAHPELVNNSVNLIDATLFVDPANLDFNFTNPDPDTNPVVATGAGLIRPNVTYTYIPTNAEIDAM
jgi:hypothetical protein